MSHMKFKEDVTVVAIPTSKVEWDINLFFKDSKFTLPKLSNDTAKLREVFVFEYPPYGVVIEDGKQVGLVPDFDEYPGAEPGITLKKFGVIE